MKMSIALAAATSVLAACATAPTPQYEASATAFTGYVLFTDGEFQLYPREAQVRTPFSRPCLSGTLPRNAQRAARTDLSGQKVTIIGTTAPWTGRGVEHEGVTIRNTCGGDFVLLGQDVTVIR